MDSAPKKAPEAMDISELLAELETSARTRSDDREVRLLRALRDRIAIAASAARQDIPLGWSPYGQGGLDAVKE